MKHLPAGTMPVFDRSVKLIAQKRIPSVLHMNSYLMSSSRFKLHFNKCEPSEAFQHPEMCYCRSCIRSVRRNHRIPETISRIPAYTCIYCTLFFSDIIPNDSPVTSVDGMLRQLHRKNTVSDIVFCSHEQTAGILVYSMHYTASDRTVY